MFLFHSLGEGVGFSFCYIPPKYSVVGSLDMTEARHFTTKSLATSEILYKPEVLVMYKCNQHAAIFPNG